MALPDGWWDEIRYFDGTNLKPRRMPKNAQTPRRRVHALLDGGTYNGTKLLAKITRVRALDSGQKDMTNTPARIMTRREPFSTNNRLQEEQTSLANRLAQELNPRASEDQLKTLCRNQPSSPADQSKLPKQRRCERTIVAGNVKVHRFSTKTILPQTLKKEKSPGV